MEKSEKMEDENEDEENRSTKSKLTNSRKRFFPESGAVTDKTSSKKAKKSKNEETKSIPVLDDLTKYFEQVDQVELKAPGSSNLDASKRSTHDENTNNSVVSPKQSNRSRK
jgi:hypothetical protein